MYFRDTAHGLLAWSIATLLAAGMLTSTIGSTIGGGAQAGGALLGDAGSGAATVMTGAGAAAASEQGFGASGTGYFVDSLFRPASPSAAASSASEKSPPDSGTASKSTVEAATIVARSLSAGAMSLDDTKYVGQMVSQRTGISQQDAEKRVIDTYAKAQQWIQQAEAKAKDAADNARKAAAYAALWPFVSLLLGAFISSLMATFGGRQRDL